MPWKVRRTAAKAEILQKEASAFSQSATNNKRPTKDGAAEISAAESRTNGIRNQRDNQSRKEPKGKKKQKTQQLWRWQRMIKRHNSQLQVGRGCTDEAINASPKLNTSIGAARFAGRKRAEAYD